MTLACEDGQQGHHQLSVKSDENKPFQPNQSALSIYIKIELCYFLLDQWEIRIHLLWGRCFNIPHHCDPYLNQTKFNDLLPLTIDGVLGSPQWRTYTPALWKRSTVEREFQSYNRETNASKYPRPSTSNPSQQIIRNVLQCSQCEKTFSGRNTLSKHRSRHHNNEFDWKDGLRSFKLLDRLIFTQSVNANGE